MMFLIGIVTFVVAVEFIVQSILSYLSVTNATDFEYQKTLARSMVLSYGIGGVILIFLSLLQLYETPYLRTRISEVL